MVSEAEDLSVEVILRPVARRGQAHPGVQWCGGAKTEDTTAKAQDMRYDTNVRPAHGILVTHTDLEGTSRGCSRLSGVNSERCA